MPARVRLDLGEVIEEARRFREFWLMDGYSRIFAEATVFMGIYMGPMDLGLSVG
jgi:hypothetical protein